MKPFIFDSRNDIHIIDLSKTLAQLDAACEFLSKLAANGDSVLFVGTKKQAQEAVKESAKACGQFFVTERWLGGTLTNFKTIRNSIARLNHIEKMMAENTIDTFGKQEGARLRREHARLFKYLDGIRNMDKLPGALFIVDVRREHNAVAEACRLNIPIVAIVDTNCDPEPITYPIAGNDDAIRSVRLILATVVQAISTGRAEHHAKYGRSKKTDEAAAASPEMAEALNSTPAAQIPPAAPVAAAPDSAS
jgi:small subunit ribosomal protein S2